MTLQGSASRANQTDETLGTRKTDQASVGAQISAPIYDGGTAASPLASPAHHRELVRVRPAAVRREARPCAVAAEHPEAGAHLLEARAVER